MKVIVREKTPFLKETLEKPVFLVGFMGVGKTSVGIQLAQYIDWNFVDTDQLITQKTGKSIQELFSEDGEAYFRQLEGGMVEESLSMNRTVVALGGGALMNPGSLEKVTSSGFSIYLKARIETLLGRLENSAESRPLLRGLSKKESKIKVEALMETRQRFYTQCKIHIQTDEKDVSRIVPEIVARLSDVIK